MKLLLVSRSPKAKALCRILGNQNRGAICHCADNLTAVQLRLEREGGYDCLVIHGAEDDPESLAIAAAVKRAHPLTSIAYFSLEGDSGLPSRPARLLGAFENTPRGMRLLNCVLSQGPAPTDGNCAPNMDGLIFEYQAPCRSRRRNGG